MATTTMVSFTGKCVVCGSEFSGSVRLCSPPRTTCSRACRRTLTLATREHRLATGTTQPHVKKCERPGAKIPPVVCPPDPPDYRSWRTLQALAELPADLRRRIEP